MNLEADFDAMEQALCRASARQAPSPLDLRRVRRRAAQRTVVRLASIQGIEHAEIAAVLGIPVGTVGSRLDEARDRLRVLLASRRATPGP